MKLGRNENCWCGSMKKYKKCHLNKEKGKRISKAEGVELTNLFTSKKKCSAPKFMKHECSNKVIKAHTLSKSNSLREIAEDGHVMGMKHGLSSMERNSGKLTFEKIGIGSASTFTGFCSIHDKALFSCIEDQRFIESLEQMTFIAYRTLMRELYVKEANKIFAEHAKDFDRGMPLAFQIFWRKKSQELTAGAELSIKDLSHLISAIKASLENKKYNALRHFIIRLADIPKVMGSGVFSPIIDLYGTETQEITLTEKRPAYMILNLLSLDSKGYMIISWLPEDDLIIMKLIKSIIDMEKSKASNKLINLSFMHLENIFSSISWWNSLGEKKGNIEKLMMQGVEHFRYDMNLFDNDQTEYGAISIESHDILN